MQQYNSWICRKGETPIWVLMLIIIFTLTTINSIWIKMGSRSLLLWRIFEHRSWNTTLNLSNGSSEYMAKKMALSTSKFYPTVSAQMTITANFFLHTEILSSLSRSERKEKTRAFSVSIGTIQTLLLSLVANSIKIIKGWKQYLLHATISTISLTKQVTTKKCLQGVYRMQESSLSILRTSRWLCFIIKSGWEPSNLMEIS